MIETKPFLLSIPTNLNPREFVSLSLSPGDTVFILGPNGAGKSALVQFISRSIPDDNFKRITAHRQNWLMNSAPDISASMRVVIERNVKNYSRHPNSRWSDQNPAEQLSSVLANLISAENGWSRHLASECQEKNIMPSEYADKSPSPISRLNRILRRGGLPIQINIADNDVVQAKHDNGALVGFAQLSDGERNAVILAADVITTPGKNIILLDEPERHLHRSIIVPIIAGLLSDRADCIFFVSTHELSLPLAKPNAKTLVLRKCSWEKDQPVAWDMDLLDSMEDISDELKAAVMGSRRRLLFIEGQQNSLDNSLFVILFPEVSIVPREGVRNVIQSVVGLRASEKLHLIKAFGLIDLDDRSADEAKKLKASGIYALPCSAIEGLYYCSHSRRAVAALQAQSYGKPVEEFMHTASESALAELNKPDTKEHLVNRRCERLVRETILKDLPRAADFATSDVQISISVSSPKQPELDVFDRLILNKSLDELIFRYPIRESGALSAIARSFRFSRRGDYEEVLLALLAKDTTLQSEIRGVLGDLSQDLN